MVNFLAVRVTSKKTIKSTKRIGGTKMISMMTINPRAKSKFRRVLIADKSNGATTEERIAAIECLVNQIAHDEGISLYQTVEKVIDELGKPSKNYDYIKFMDEGRLK